MSLTAALAHGVVGSVSSVLTANPAPTPTPTQTPFPDYTGNPNLITPGVVGFLAILGVAVVTVFLIVDMTRRIRRSRYREEVRLQLEAEQEAAEAAAAKAARSGKSGTNGGPRADAPKTDAPELPEDPGASTPGEG